VNKLPFYVYLFGHHRRPQSWCASSTKAPTDNIFGTPAVAQTLQAFFSISVCIWIKGGLYGARSSESTGIDDLANEEVNFSDRDDGTVDGVLLSGNSTLSLADDVVVASAEHACEGESRLDPALDAADSTVDANYRSVYNRTSMRGASHRGERGPWSEESQGRGRMNYPALEISRWWLGPTVACLKLLRKVARLQ
jgi:hypothetical protein